MLYNNTAVNKGGGVHAVSSIIKATSKLTEPDTYFSTDYKDAVIFKYEYISTRTNFTNNEAEKGGGLSLEANAKLYILKHVQYVRSSSVISFTANNANYGGAVYVDDDTNSSTCASEPKAECFFQVFAIYDQEPPNLQTQSMFFSENLANISGSILYGGLLDRCAVSQFSEIYKLYQHDYEDRGDGILYLKNVSTPTYYSYEPTHKEVSNISI